MPTLATKRPPSVVTRRVGYVLNIVVNIVLLGLLNVDPRWTALPFLTSETTRVLGLVNASLIVGILTRAVLMLTDVELVNLLGDLVTTSVSLAVMTRLWTVFPFEFGAFFFGNAAVVARTVLVVSVIGTAIAILVSLVRLIRVLTSWQDLRPER